MSDAGFDVVHVYGLTETYGPAVVNEWKDEWNTLDGPGRAAKKARQGVKYVPLQDLSVRDPESMAPVPDDGETLGEVMFRGNVVMKGLSEEPGRNRGSLLRRLVPFRRSWRAASGWLCTA